MSKLRTSYGPRTRTFTTTDGPWKRVKAGAKAEGVTVAEYVRRALCYYLGRHR